MKKLIGIIGVMLAIMVIQKYPEVEKPMEEPVEVQEELYMSCGRYYDGYIVDDNGEEWGYQWDYEGAYEGIPVKIVMSDNGTPSIYDDIVLNIGYDRETAIYDELEKSFSQVEDWEVTRDGNQITIEVIEE